MCEEYKKPIYCRKEIKWQINMSKKVKCDEN